TCAVCSTPATRACGPSGRDHSGCCPTGSRSGTRWPVSFTYSQPWTAARDYVRFLIPDTVGATALFQDEELDSLLSNWSGDARLAAAEALEALAGLYARNAISYSVTGFSLDRKSVSRALLDRAKALREAALAVPFEFE